MTEKYTSLIDLYVDTFGGSEPPECFQRWSIITGLSAVLGRRVFFQHGSFNLYPTMYAIMVGVPGTRKSTAIKQLKKVVKAAGYHHFSADKTTKEKFLVDLDGTHKEEDDKKFGSPKGRRASDDSFCLESLFDGTPESLTAGSDLSEDSSAPREAFICADEFYDFIGSQNIDFISLLGNLWDYEGIFEYKTRHGREVLIPEPTISLLGGCTFETFSMAFPAAILGQGFLSRLLMVYAEPTGRKITWPAPPDGTKVGMLSASLSLPLKMLTHESLMLVPSAGAMKTLDELYHSWQDLPDARLRNYSNRRFSHLLKLVQICFMARLLLHHPEKILPSTTLQVESVDVVAANTYLSAIEQNMSKALGEFGRSKNSPVQQTILETLRASSKGLAIEDLWKSVSRDLEDIRQLAGIITGMKAAGIIELVQGQGWFAVGKQAPLGGNVDLGLLSESERKML